MKPAQRRLTWLLTRSAQRLPMWLLIAGLLAGLAAALHTAQHNRAESDALLAQAGERLANRIAERFRVYEYGLRGARGAVVAVGAERMTATQYALYSRSRDLEREFPGALGFGFIRHVPAARAAAFVAEQRRQGRPDFDIVQLQRNAGDRYVIEFIEPVTANQAALGLDIASEPLRRAAANQAARSRLPTLTAPITLMQANAARQRGFLLLLAVDDNDNRVAHAGAAPAGWVYAPLVVDRVLADLDVDEGVQWQLDDVQDARHQRLFDSTAGLQAGGASAAAASGPMPMVRDLVVGQRRWQLAVAPQPGFAGRQPSPWRSAMGLAMLGALLAGLVAAATASARQQALKASEAEVTEARNRLQALIDNMPALIAYVDDARFIRYVNQVGCDLLGRRTAELVGQALESLPGLPVPADRLAGVLEGRVQTFEQPLTRADGSRLMLLTTYSPDRQQGRLCGFFVQGMDISARIQAEQQLRDSEERFRLLVDGAAEHAIVMLDAQGCIESWNPGAAQQRGYRADEVLGCSGALLYSPEERAAGRPAQDLEHARRDGRFECEGWRIRKDGSRFWANVVISALRDDSGTLRGYCKITRDLSVHHRREIELERARSLAESAVRAKSEFLAAMSHELRTPMTSVLGYSALLLKGRFGAMNERQTEFVNSVQSSGKQLLRLIEDVLDLAKIESDKLMLNIETFDPRRTVDGLRAVIGALAIRRRITVEFSVDAAVTEVSWDEARIKQVLFNLLSNAVKFSHEQGRVALNVIATGDDHVRLQVRDEGVGIAPAEQVKLFGRFTQADGGLTRQHEGTGLGLALARRLVELHGGHIDLISAPGKGSIFSVLLPRQARISPAGKAAPPTELLAVEQQRRHLAEEHLADSEQALSVALGSIGAGFIAADREGRVIRMNAVAERLLGWPRAEAEGRGLFEVFAREGRTPEAASRNPVELMIEQAISVDMPHHVMVRSRSGTLTPVEVKGALTYSEDGSIRGLVMLFRDLSATSGSAARPPVGSVALPPAPAAVETAAEGPLTAR